MKPASAIPNRPGSNPKWNPLRELAATRDSLIDPTATTAADVCGLKIFASERTLLFEEFEDSFAELDAGGPSFVDAGAREDIGAARTLTDAGVAVACKKRFAMTTRLLQGFRAPGFERATFEVMPEIRMKDEMLEIAIGSADRTAEPRRNEDADGGEAVGVNVEEAEDFRLGIAEGVKDGARFERTVFGKLDHHLHAESPFGGVRVVRNAEMRVDGAADGAHRAIADDGERSADVHAGHESILRRAAEISALIGEANSDDGVVLDQW